MTTFGQRLAEAMDQRGPLCVGIDPHPALLRQWGLPVDPKGLAQFSFRVIEAIGEVAAVLKPQSAFFEAFGSAGISVLEEVLRLGHEAGALMVLDGKRGDIGSTMDGYAAAYLDPAAPLGCDALTVSPYLGFGSLLPMVQASLRADRGLFVLALTSNPEGPQVQQARGPEGRSVAQYIVDSCAQTNASATGVAPGSIGIVVGATANTAGLSLEAFNGPILAPGIGAQGATAGDLRRVFGNARGRVLASSSRQILAAGPSVSGLRDTAVRQVKALRAVLCH